jgi:hypothetical protein
MVEASMEAKSEGRTGTAFTAAETGTVVIVSFASTKMASRTRKSEADLEVSNDSHVEAEGGYFSFITQMFSIVHPILPAPTGSCKENLDKTWHEVVVAY